jgi:hypothetical protein
MTPPRRNLRLDAIILRCTESGLHPPPGATRPMLPVGPGEPDSKEAHKAKTLSP